MSNHDELMSNFFAQPDALALGKTADELKARRRKTGETPKQQSRTKLPLDKLMTDIDMKTNDSIRSSDDYEE